MSLSKSGIPYLKNVWNPCGFGCSKGCDGCWARRMAPRVGKNIGCKDCADFKVHFHPERLGLPAAEKQPSVIGVQFTGELFDPERPDEDIHKILRVLVGSDLDGPLCSHHEFVFLTQQPAICRGWISHITNFWSNMPPLDNWYLGQTVRNQIEMDKWFPITTEFYPREWLSLEPLRGPITFSRRSGFDPLSGKMANIQKTRFPGVIVGCDNRQAAPFEIAWVRDIVVQCQAAKVPVFVKQIRIDGKLLRDPKDFPEDLRIRQLPWKLKG